MYCLKLQSWYDKVIRLGSAYLCYPTVPPSLSTGEAKMCTTHVQASHLGAAETSLLEPLII